MRIRDDFVESNKLGLDILDLLQRTAILESAVSEPRDRVFSLLGLADAKARKDIPVRYQAALAEVFANVFRPCSKQIGEVRCSLRALAPR